MAFQSHAHLAFGTPRKLCRPSELHGQVVVLDIAFASEISGGGFEKITEPFIHALGDRLRAWVDHHDHTMHAKFASDTRFVLGTKTQFSSCAEMITPEICTAAGHVDTILCHTDFDGLVCAAKWLCGGSQPYDQCNDDARAIDTRIGQPTEIAIAVDRAIRARPRDQGLWGLIVRYLANGCTDTQFGIMIREAANELRAAEQGAHKYARSFVRLEPGVAIADISGHSAPIDKTLLLMLGQERERIAIVVDGDTVSVAARFDSGIDLLKLFGLSGGMPTRVSMRRKDLANIAGALGIKPGDFEALNL